MSNFLTEPFLMVVHEEGPAPLLSPASEIFLRRVATLVYGLARRAPQTAVMQAASAGSDTALIRALADMVITEAPADAMATALLRGRLALAECLEASGGVWTAEEAVDTLRVKRQTLQLWRDQGRVIALRRSDGSYSYPIAQFAPATSDASVPRPYDAIRTMHELVGGHLSAEELVSLFATPQPMLRDAAGHEQTPFQVLAAGDVDRVLDLVRWVVTPPDADAPLVPALPMPAEGSPSPESR